MSVVIDGTTGITVPSGASQAQAEAGTDNTVLMTPLRTAQAIGALATSGLEFISSATISNVATVDFTGFDSSKYSDYVFSLSNVIPVTDGQYLGMRMSTDGGSTYITSNGYVFNHIYSWFGGSMNLTSSSSSGLTSAIFLNDQRPIGSDTNEFGISGEVKVFGPDLAARTQVTFSGAFVDSSGFFVQQLSIGSNQITTAVNAVRFLFFSGNLESGVISMYGVRKS
jgi:hypothetical protein